MLRLLSWLCTLRVRSGTCGNRNALSEARVWLAESRVRSQVPRLETGCKTDRVDQLLSRRRGWCCATCTYTRALRFPQVPDRTRMVQSQLNNRSIEHSEIEIAA